MYTITNEKQLEYCIYHRINILIPEVSDQLYMPTIPEFEGLKPFLGRIHITASQNLPTDIFPN